MSYPTPTQLLKEAEKHLDKVPKPLRGLMKRLHNKAYQGRDKLHGGYTERMPIKWVHKVWRFMKENAGKSLAFGRIEWDRVGRLTYTSPAGALILLPEPGTKKDQRIHYTASIKEVGNNIKAEDKMSNIEQVREIADNIIESKRSAGEMKHERDLKNLGNAYERIALDLQILAEEMEDYLRQRYDDTWVTKKKLNLVKALQRGLQRDATLILR